MAPLQKWKWQSCYIWFDISDGDLPTITHVYLFEPMKRIPQPVPDPENPLHYKSVDATPTESSINGKPRERDVSPDQT